MTKKALQTKKVELQAIYAFDARILSAKRDLFTSDEKALLCFDNNHFAIEESELVATMIEINEVQYAIDRIEAKELTE